MTTDAERREATDQWTIQLREQRVRELTETLHRRNATISEQQQQLATITAERDALTREVAGLRYYIAQLERNVSQEERAYAAGIARLMLSQYDIDNAQPRE